MGETMYEYREMTEAERAKVLAGRKLHLRPWHAPPHFDQTQGVYLISAACYEHRSILATEIRRTEWETAIVDRLGQEEPEPIEIRGWVVLPNHYHLLLEGDLRVFARRIARLHNGTATQWNREDNTPGRKVWHRFSDRIVRSERHYYASLNYMHANPVKHGHAATADAWTWSSLSLYMEMVGRERLAEWRREYPVGEYGKGWDE
jgi:putative transposase